MLWIQSAFNGVEGIGPVLEARRDRFVLVIENRVLVGSDLIESAVKTGDVENVWIVVIERQQVQILAEIGRAGHKIDALPQLIEIGAGAPVLAQIELSQIGFARGWLAVLQVNQEL